MISLGLASNYSFFRTLHHLFAFGTRKDSLRLRQALADHSGQSVENVALYHTGRSALAVALRSVAKGENLPVIIPGLTCIAVVRAVKAAGCTPIFVDIEANNLQYNLQNLEKTLANLPEIIKNSTLSIKSIDKKDNACYNEDNGSESPALLCHDNAKKRGAKNVECIIIIQNTLGYTIDITKVEALARQYNAVIVEDLAHSAGRFYPDGRAVGTVGAAVAYSFGKAKAIDTISGGAAILRNNIVQPTQKAPLSARLRERWYPALAGISRIFWPIGLGKAFLAVCLKFHWIEKSADAEMSFKHRLTHWQARLAWRQLGELPPAPVSPAEWSRYTMLSADSASRQQSSPQDGEVQSFAQHPLREYTFVRGREKLLAELERQGYHLCDIWYDVPVSPARYAGEVNFPADACPETVKISQHIINLPTWYPEHKLTKAREIIRKYEVEL